MTFTVTVLEPSLQVNSYLPSVPAVIAVEPSFTVTSAFGSVVVTLSPTYLETLSAGDHELMATFADGDDVAVGFKVLEVPVSGEADSDGGSDSASPKAPTTRAATPKTGDVTPLALPMSCAALGLVALVASRRRERGSVHDKRDC